MDKGAAMKYEYCMQIIYDSDEVNDELERRNKLGWEFITATYDSEYRIHYLYFRKEGKS